MEKRRKEDDSKYPTWKILCSIMASLLILITGFFITTFIMGTDTSIKNLYAIKADKVEMQDIKTDLKDIQADIKLLLRRGR
jgi:peptidoglycan hydrolase CwlO-like protein